MNKAITVLWRRLDVPGHDACRFAPSDNGWALCGLAVFLEGGEVCQIRYEVLADPAFQTQKAAVAGWIGDTAVDVRVRATDNGVWIMNDAEQPSLAGCIDLDLGFTPATNFLSVRRLALRVGEETQVSAAYLAFPELRFEILPQRYKRISDTEYEYQAPTADYSGILAFSAPGVIASYPGLFVEER